MHAARLTINIRSITNPSMAQKGHTGREGELAKTYGGIAAAIGLVWALLAYALSDGSYILVLPLILIIGGGLTFFVGRGSTKGR